MSSPVKTEQKETVVAFKAMGVNAQKIQRVKIGIGG